MANVLAMFGNMFAFKGSFQAEVRTRPRGALKRSVQKLQLAQGVLGKFHIAKCEINLVRPRAHEEAAADGQSEGANSVREEAGDQGHS